MIERNRAGYGRWGNFQFGLAQTLDGLVRVLTLGFCHGKHSFTPLMVSKRLTYQQLKREKERQSAQL